MGNACASYEETDVVEVRPSPSSPTPLSPHQWRAQKLAKWSQAERVLLQAMDLVAEAGSQNQMVQGLKNQLRKAQSNIRPDSSPSSPKTRGKKEL